MSWWLENVEEKSKRLPQTFDIPARELRESLATGENAKLLIYQDAKKSGCIGEPVWVEVTEVGDNAYRGKLLKKPSVIKKLKQDQEIDFLALHVWQIGGAPS